MRQRLPNTVLGKPEDAMVCGPGSYEDFYLETDSLWGKNIRLYIPRIGEKVKNIFNWVGINIIFIKERLDLIVPLDRASKHEIARSYRYRCRYRHLYCNTVFLLFDSALSP